MANAIINHDYTRMQHPKFSKYKKRFPPTLDSVKHSLIRLAEVTYRIGLLSLVWTVCGGSIFSIVMLYELFLTVIRLIFMRDHGMLTLDADTILLNVNSLIVIPSEEFFAYNAMQWKWNDWLTCSGDDSIKIQQISCVMNMCCCLGLSGALSAFSYIIRCKDKKVPFIPTTRNGISLIEFLIVIFYGIYGENGERQTFLLEFNHGLSIFIAAFVFYIVFTQYLVLFPNFRLPFGVNIRSKWGYAYGNELTELQKIKVPVTDENIFSVYIEWNRSDKFFDEPFEFQHGRPLTLAMIAAAGPAILMPTFDRNQMKKDSRMSDLDIDKYEIKIEEEYKKQHEEKNKKMLQWMEQNGAVSHLNVNWKTFEISKQRISENYDISEETGKKQKKTRFELAYDNDFSGLKYMFGNRGVKNVIKKIVPSRWRKLDEDAQDYDIYQIQKEGHFWDEPSAVKNGIPLTATVYALVQGNNEIVQWFESRGAVTHKIIYKEEAMQLFEKYNFDPKDKIIKKKKKKKLTLIMHIIYN
eukprot:115798_1